MGKKLIWIVIILLAVITIGGYILFFSKLNYITLNGDFYHLFRKYRKLEDIDYHGDDIKVRRGAFADSIEGYEQVVEIDNMEIVFNSNTEKRIYIVVKGNNITFGKKRICVGDSRKKIESVFKYSKRPKPSYSRYAYYDEQGNCIVTNIEEYCDDAYLISVGFEYDENECVKAIFIGYGPNV